MIIAVVAVMVLVAVVLRAALRARRRRSAETMFVTSIPGIELGQAYGSWDANAYDTHGTPPRYAVAASWHSGPPSTWGRYP